MYIVDAEMLKKRSSLLRLYGSGAMLTVRNITRSWLAGTVQYTGLSGDCGPAYNQI